MKDICHQLFIEKALPALCAFVKNPSQSSNFDSDWERRGDILRACEDAVRWAREMLPEGTFEVIREPGRTPVVYVDIAASARREDEPAVFFYGHFDKQPESTGWNEGLAPFTPVIRDGRLYGRGSCDDGFSFYAAVTAVKAVQTAGFSHPRITGLYESDEESGSKDYPYFLKKLRPRFGNVGTVFVLDSSANDYENLWVTSSLRGIIATTLRVKTLDYPVHSGMFSGVVPDAYLTALHLIDRVCDFKTGFVTLPEFARNVTDTEMALLEASTAILGENYFDRRALAEGVDPLFAKPIDGVVSNLYRASLCVIGIDGPSRVQTAGNVLYPEVALRLSIRIPSLVNLKTAYAALEKALTENAPHGARVSLENPSLQSGWAMKLDRDDARLGRLNDAARSVFASPARFIGIGASIPIVYDFEAAFPDAVCVLTGVEGPGSNAHGPNESLVIDYTEKLILSLALYLKA